MKLTYKGLISNNFVNHAKKTISNGEILTYYIDKSIGWNSIDRYIQLENKNIEYIDTLSTYNIGHKDFHIEFIRNTFKKLDDIIDLDFHEMSHNNGSMLDIYHVNYSSNFGKNVIGQALAQQTSEGAWWDIFWKDAPLNSNLHTIIHEIGHTIGLSHPFEDPLNKDWHSSDTVMSYNVSPDGWNTWFSPIDLNALISIWGRENDLGFIKYENTSSQYKYQKSSNGKLFIKTTVGLEDITNIDTLKFSDKSIDVNQEIIGVFKLLENIDDITGKVYRLYNATFGRFPDKAGLKYWIEKNKSKIDSYRSTAQSFILSNEFQSLYGSNTTNADYIESLYTNVLDREPDQEGFNYWFDQIESGNEDRSELLMGFSESQENKIIFSSETSIF